LREECIEHGVLVITLSCDAGWRWLRRKWGVGLQTDDHMKSLTLILSMALLICTGCGGDTHESLAAEQMDVMKKMNSVLDGVKDLASAKAAKPELKSLIAKMKDIEARSSKLPAPTAADTTAMKAKYGGEMDPLMQKFVGNMMRVGMDPQIAPELQDLDQAMKTAVQ
jgi:hypothetical protein